MPLPQPEFQDAPERKLVGLSRDFTMQTRSEIPQLWNDFWSRKWDLPGNVDKACYGVSYAAQQDGRFSYAVALPAEPVPETLPEGACLVTLSAGRYAVFGKRGAAQEIPELFDAIFTRWLPQSGEKQREGAVFERYPNEEQATPDAMFFEVWVPIAG